MFKYLIRCGVLFILLSSALVANDVVENDVVADVKWKTEDEIRDLYGEPIEINGPVGTHASYMLWSYKGFYIAFANGRAFHRFDNKDKVLQEPEESDY